MSLGLDEGSDAAAPCDECEDDHVSPPLPRVQYLPVRPVRELSQAQPQEQAPQFERSSQRRAESTRRPADNAGQKINV